MKTIWKAISFAAALAIVQVLFSSALAAQTVAATRAIGTVQTISGASLTLKTDQGVVTSITVKDGAKILRLEPGQTSLSAAAPIDLDEIQAGDRVLASGDAGSGPNTILASTVVAIKKADVESKQQSDLQDWTKRGVGGLVTAVDPAAGTVSLKVTAA